MTDLVVIHEVKPKAKCSLSGKEGECVVASFKDGTFTNLQVSWNALKQLVRLKGEQKEKKT